MGPVNTNDIYITIYAIANQIMLKLLYMPLIYSYERVKTYYNDDNSMWAIPRRVIYISTHELVRKLSKVIYRDTCDIQICMWNRSLGIDGQRPIVLSRNLKIFMGHVDITRLCIKVCQF